MTAPRVLIAVITGGRPPIKSRTTAKLLPGLASEGFSDIEWVVREDHAKGYELDDFPLNVYPAGFDDDYSRNHWEHPAAVWAPGGFHGAFPGREWAMRTGEARGYDMVLQVDDNIGRVGVIDCKRAASHLAVSPAGVVGLVRDIAWATNVSMMGIQLNAVGPAGSGRQLVRVGFPYSLFVEKTGPGRMPWVGPFEDDIMHALEYGLHGGPSRTVALLPMFKYDKQTGGGDGMRKHYDPTRGLQLAKRYPNNATLRVSKKSVSPTDRQRGIRHLLNTKGFTPVRVTDCEMFQQATARAERYVADFTTEFHASNREKIRTRAGLTSV